MAFNLLKTSAKSWYSEGTLKRSGIGALEPAELAQSLIPSEWSWRVNCTEPSSLHAHIYAAAETREMGGAVPGDDGGTTEVVRGDGRIRGGTTSSEDEAGGLGPRGAGKLCTLEQKVMLLSNQSINGLCWQSQLCPRTSEQEESSKVT